MTAISLRLIAVCLLVLTFQIHAETETTETSVAKQKQARAERRAKMSASRKERERLKEEARLAKCQNHSTTHYDSDAAHPLNQVYEAFYVRQDGEGCYFGLDTLDPLLYDDTAYLFEAAALNKALDALKAIEGLALSPIQKALLQRDLLQVLHWSASQKRNEAKTLSTALVHSIRLLALTEQEIKNLPDNLDTATRKAGKGMLTQAIRSAVIVSDLQGPAATVHLKEFRYGSAFFVHYMLPGGHAESAEYVRQLGAFKAPMLKSHHGKGSYRNPKTPQFPAGTRFALVRKAILWSQEGRAVVSPLTESVQLREYRAVEPTDKFSPGDRNQTAELYELARSQYLKQAGPGLVNLTENPTPQFDSFLSHYADPVAQKTALPSSPLDKCVRCHAQLPGGEESVNVGIHSVHSYTKEFDRKFASRLMLEGLNGESRKILKDVERESWGFWYLRQIK